MMGRYGIDELTQALMLLGCGFVLVNFFAHSGILSVFALLFMALGIFRCYSRNIAARSRELAKYQDAMVKPKAWWRLLNKKWVNRKTTIYFKCKGCGTVLFEGFRVLDAPGVSRKRMSFSCRKARLYMPDQIDGFA